MKPVQGDKSITGEGVEWGDGCMDKGLRKCAKEGPVSIYKDGCHGRRVRLSWWCGRVFGDERQRV